MKESTDSAQGMGGGQAVIMLLRTSRGPYGYGCEWHRVSQAQFNENTAASHARRSGGDRTPIRSNRTRTPDRIPDSNVAFCLFQLLFVLSVLRCRSQVYTSVFKAAYASHVSNTVHSPVMLNVSKAVFFVIISAMRVAPSSPILHPVMDNMRPNRP